MNPEPRAGAAHAPGRRTTLKSSNTMRTQRILKGHFLILPTAIEAADGGFVWCVNVIERGAIERVVSTTKGDASMPREADALDMAARMAEQIAATFEPDREPAHES